MFYRLGLAVTHPTSAELSYHHKILQSQRSEGLRWIVDRPIEVKKKTLRFFQIYFLSRA